MKRTITALFLLSLILIVGCEYPDDEAPLSNNSNESAASDEDASADDQAPIAGKTKKGKIVLGNMLEPFTPPTLEELNAQAEKQGGWVVNPVKDGSKLVYQYLNGEPAPTTVEEALNLKNDSPENNNKIRHTLGRLPENEEKEVDYEQTVVRQSPSDAKSVNPIMMSSVTEFDIAGLMSVGILSHTYDTMESYAPSDTVREWKTMPDRYCDMFVLRDDITWSDGEPFTAYDIEFSFKLIMTREVPTPAMRSGTDQIKACVAYDKNTLVFFHKEPLVTNTINMNFAIVPKHVYEKTWADDPSLTKIPEHVALENNPVVAGPYKISKRETGQYIELDAREDYYMHNGKKVRDKPYFKKVRINIIPSPEIALMAMKRGDLDYMQIDFNQWDTQTSGPEFYAKCTKVQAVEWTSFHFCWNLKTQYFEDVRVRKAMSYAFNYKEMFDVILFNLAEPSCGIYHPLNPAYPKDAKPPYHQDLVEAIRLLKEAGWEDHDGDGLLDKFVTAGAMIHNNEIYFVKGGKRASINSWSLFGGAKGKEIVAKDGMRYVIENDKTFIVSKDGSKTEVKKDNDTIVLNADHIVLTNGKKMELPQYYLPFEFTLYCNNSSPIALQICELMMQCLKSIGVACNVRPVEFTTLMQKTQCHEFEAFLGGWGAGTDPDTSENIWGTGKDRNYGYYSNPEVDRLFKEGKHETNRAKRMALYGRIHNIIYEEQPYTFLYNRNAFYAVSKRIRGYGFYPRGIIEGNIWVPKKNETQVE